jgi:hypothetical protein
MWAAMYEGTLRVSIQPSQIFEFVEEGKQASCMQGRLNTIHYTTSLCHYCMPNPTYPP